MTRTPVLIAALAASVAACGGGASDVGADLERDLAQARASSVDLAPRGANRTLVVSAEEQTGAAPRRAPRRETPQRAPRAKSRVAAPAAAAPEQPVAVPVPAPVPEAAQPAPRPEPEPAVTGPLRRPPEATPAPPGGWRSVGDVIRNSPIPINP